MITRHTTTAPLTVRRAFPILLLITVLLFCLRPGRPPDAPGRMVANYTPGTEQLLLFVHGEVVEPYRAARGLVVAKPRFAFD
jgi:hypothetical protein